MIRDIKNLLHKGEGPTLEFKESQRGLPRNLFETICAFLNTQGGTILLGVTDQGAVTGVDPDQVAALKTDLANLSNNPQKIDPVFVLSVHDMVVQGKSLIVIQVPESSQVHRCNGDIFIRREDGDFKVTRPEQIAGIVNRKTSYFSEQKVLPFVTLEDFSPDLFDRAARLMRANQSRHPWAALAPEELLKKAGFYKKDSFTNQEGYTLASVLMFGTDEVIQANVPAYKFDALLRRRDTERYDDRLMVRTNLIDAYDQLMGFVEKHLNDPFYLEGDMRISLRDKIFRELVANIIAHREYIDARPATMVIYRDRVEFKNPNIPNGTGPIDPADFTPCPKNPTICKFMIQLGRFDELGSGVMNVSRYLPFYTKGGKPLFVEGDMFSVIIPVDGEEAAELGPQPESGPKSGPKSGQESGIDSGPESAVDMAILKALKSPLASREIANVLGHKKLSGAVKRAISRLLDQELIEYTIPEKPKSSLQKYKLTEKGRVWLRKHGGKK